MVPRRPLVAIAGGIGFLLVLVGLTVMVGWLRHWPWAVKLGSDRLLIVFATGVNLTLLGAGLAALLVGTVRPNVRWADPVPRGLGGVVAVLSTLRLAEMITGWPIGLDFPGMHTWLDRQWVTGWIGGMHPSHALAMAASATALSLVPTLRNRTARGGSGAWSAWRCCSARATCLAAPWRSNICTRRGWCGAPRT
nr:hypothetical protein [Ralstonia pickettii]